MAEVYARVKGKKLTKIIALHRTVQDELDRVALDGAYRAESDLVLHRAQGHARIVVEEGDVDRYVVLDDEFGLEAALSIEYGRAARVDENGVEHGAMQGLFILHKALGMRRREHGPTDGGDTLE